MSDKNYIVKNSSVSCDKDKTETAFRTVQQLKQDKIKGKMVLHFDGSGRVARVEVIQEL
jgi:hypothetical protein